MKSCVNVCFSNLLSTDSAKSRVESALKNISSDRNAGGGSSSNSAPPNDHFQSTAARQIHSEISVNPGNSAAAMSKQQLTEMANQYKRNVPRKKKRHNTAPNSVHNEVFNDYLATRNASKQVNSTLHWSTCWLKITTLNSLSRTIPIGPETIWTWKLPFGQTSRSNMPNRISYDRTSIRLSFESNSTQIPYDTYLCVVNHIRHQHHEMQF